MIQRPLEYLNWAASGNITEPPSALKSTGWQPGMKPPAQFTNWQINLIDQWIQWFDAATEEGQPDQVLRLLNGGYWSWNLTTSTFAWSSTFNLGVAGVPDANNACAANSVVMNDGDVAYVTVNEPIIALGNTNSSVNPTYLTNMNFTQGIAIGDSIVGPGIPTGTTVVAVGSGSVQLSAAATSTNVQAQYIFASAAGLSVTVVPNANWQPQLDTIMIARRSGSIVYVGVNTGQMVLRDLEFKPLLGSGYFDTYVAPAGQALTAGQVVYISPGGASDSGRTAGALYPLDCSAQWGGIRANFAGVVITAVNTGDQCTIVYNGFYVGVGLSQGVPYFADPAVPGGITTLQPAGAGQKIVPIGFAVTATSLLVTSFNGVTSSLSQPVMESEHLGYGTGTQTVFTLSTNPLNATALFVFVDGLLIPSSQWSLSGTTLTFTTAPDNAASVHVQYVLANQAYLYGTQASLGFGDGATTAFTLPFTPLGAGSVNIFADGVLRTDYVLQTGSTNSVLFNTAPETGVEVYVIGVTPIGLNAQGIITSGLNLGTGAPVYKDVVGPSLRFKSIKAGTNVTVGDDGNTITISATGGGGGGGSVIEAHGSVAAPTAFDATGVGLAASVANDQVWWLNPGSGDGAVNVSALTQVQAGATVGQRLTLKGTSASDFYQFSDGNGLSLNGPVNLTNNQSIVLTWDGTQWSEDTRRA